MKPRSYNTTVKCKILLWVQDWNSCLLSFGWYTPILPFDFTLQVSNTMYSPILEWGPKCSLNLLVNAFSASLLRQFGISCLQVCTISPLSLSLKLGSKLTCFNRPSKSCRWTMFVWNVYVHASLYYVWIVCASTLSFRSTKRDVLYKSNPLIFIVIIKLRWAFSMDLLF